MAFTATDLLFQFGNILLKGCVTTKRIIALCYSFQIKVLTPVTPTELTEVNFSRMQKSKETVEFSRIY